MVHLDDEPLLPIVPLVSHHPEEEEDWKVPKRTIYRWILMGISLTLGLSLALVCLSLSPEPKTQTGRLTLLISLDGFRPEYLSRGLTPHLSSLVASGISAEYMIPVFPAITFPNHYSIVTGLYPHAHGIVGNVFYDSAINDTFIYTNTEKNGQSQWWKGEPLWVTAIQQGKRAATCMWPGSEAEINGVRPTHWLQYTHSMTLNQKIDQILDWADLDQDERVDLMVLYIPDIDMAGHQAGVNSDEVNESLAKVDKALEYLSAGLDARQSPEQFNIIIVSDHGMSNSSPKKVLYLDDYMDVLQVQIIDNGPLFMIYPSNASDTLSVYQRLRQGAIQSGKFQAWLREDVPPTFHFIYPDRIAPILIFAELVSLCESHTQGWVFTTRAQYNGSGTPPWPIGMHGYSSSEPDMHSIFIGNGPAFKQSSERVPGFINVELYGLLCRILQIVPSSHNGTNEWLDYFADHWLQDWV